MGILIVNVNAILLIMAVIALAITTMVLVDKDNESRPKQKKPLYEYRGWSNWKVDKILRGVEREEKRVRALKKALR